MRPRVAERDHSTQALGSFVNQLQTAIPKLDSDLAKVQKAVTKTVEEAKPTKEEVSTHPLQLRVAVGTGGVALCAMAAPHCADARHSQILSLATAPPRVHG